MSVGETVLKRVPEPFRSFAYKHRELVKFAVVGGTCFVIDTALFLGLKSTILTTHPVTAKIIATLIATIVSYILNREWSFRTRGGRERPHEAALFFLVSGIGVGLNSVPLWISRYGLQLDYNHLSPFGVQVADFVSAQIIGTLLAMGFRWWAFKKFVFPDANARPRLVTTEDED
ncbi:putative flippase GtrA [Kutzneria viridogrisea]|uniref:Flippase GtrA n=1 Tax=Kutzneria viridogrisea TaxID=47990 RepID=A0ABR6BI41_9PSEU|nr:GtrA family protein [Kutzneria albida]MBA8926558.1 putative flippase GtrA [Kutzneria viridogrisea]